MTQARSPVSLTHWLFAAIALLAWSPAQADSYAEVAQLVRAGQLPQALRLAEQHLVAQPKDPQMRFMTGVIECNSGNTQQAIARFTGLTEDYPELPEPYNNLAVLHAGQGQWDKARAALEMAVRTNPAYATAHENLGDIYARLALESYGHSLQFDASKQAAVAPKMALIRTLTNPPGASGEATPLPAPCGP